MLVRNSYKVRAVTALALALALTHTWVPRAEWRPVTSRFVPGPSDSRCGALAWDGWTVEGCVRAVGGLALVGSRGCVAVVLGAHTDHVYSRCFPPPSLAPHATSCAFPPEPVSSPPRATVVMENVTVRESARLRARRAESSTAHSQPSAQPGSDPAATATPSTAQPGTALADSLPGTIDATPSHGRSRPS